MDRRAFIAGAASLVVAPRALARVGSGLEVALVTADEEARLVAVALATGRVHRYVRTLPRPRSIEAVGPMVVVAHSEIGALTLVRSSSLAVEHVLRGLGEPRYTAGHPDGRHAYVTDAKHGEVVALDVLRGRVLAREDVGALARHITIDPTGRRLWIALGTKAEQIAVVDVSRRARPRLLRRFRPPFLAHDVGWAPDRKRVWVSSGDRNEVAIYQVRTGRLLKRLPADEPPQHFTFRGDLVYVASGESGTLRVHRVDGAPGRKTTIPPESYNVQQAYGWVVTPALGRGTLCVLDRRGRVRWRRTIARSSHDACIVVTRG
jgi:6-phosphogluconolactonase (cycloisomerase 2 family)